jgi:hypothetical protein
MLHVGFGFMEQAGKKNPTSCVRLHAIPGLARIAQRLCEHVISTSERMTKLVYNIAMS